jgi:hypothetical protein
MLMVLAFLPVSTLQAAMVGTDKLIQAEQAQLDKSEILDHLQTEEAKDALATLGVDAKDLEQRVAHMTPEELSQFNAQLNDMPAGGLGIVGAVIFVLVLLIVLDLLGATNIFPSIKPIN